MLGGLDLVPAEAFDSDAEEDDSPRPEASDITRP